MLIKSDQVKFHRNCEDNELNQLTRLTGTSQKLTVLKRWLRLKYYRTTEIEWAFNVCNIIRQLTFLYVGICIITYLTSSNPYLEWRQHFESRVQ